jgi:hypothetical protein
MISFNSASQTAPGLLFEKHITLQAAAALTGYNIQYLRRLLRSGKLNGAKIGQIWLIELASLEVYLGLRQNNQDRRCGPKSNWVELVYSIVNTPRLQTYTPRDQVDFHECYGT